jgi:hypothetical protein
MCIMICLEYLVVMPWVYCHSNQHIMCSVTEIYTVDSSRLFFFWSWLERGLKTWQCFHTESVGRKVKEKVGNFFSLFFFPKKIKWKTKKMLLVSSWGRYLMLLFVGHAWRIVNVVDMLNTSHIYYRFLYSKQVTCLSYISENSVIFWTRKF